jgi:polynucleotide 5'-hydroxyl-kinase GRC3/NOL9
MQQEGVTLHSADDTDTMQYEGDSQMDQEEKTGEDLAGTESEGGNGEEEEDEQVRIPHDADPSGSIERGEKRPLEASHSQDWSVVWLTPETARVSLPRTGACVLLMGRGSVCCRQGAVQGHGFTLVPNNNEWYAWECPAWSSWLTLQATSDAAVVEIRSRRPGAFPPTENTGAAPIHLQPDPNIETTQPEALVVHGPALPPHLDSDKSDAATASFSLHDWDDPQSRPTLVLPSWQEAADRILSGSSNPSIAVAGAKGVGKSTLVRYLIHRFLSQTASHVYVLDGDMGQPELGPPGMLTLTHFTKAQPLWSLPHDHMVVSSSSQNPLEPAGVTQEAIFYGGTTSQLDPTRYLQSLAQLMETYQQSSPLGPLIVNLDGWVKGLGYQLLSTFLTTHTPTHVVQIVGTVASQQVDLSGVVDAQITTVHTVKSYRSADNVVPALSVPPVAWRDLRFVHYWLADPTLEVDFSQNYLIQDEKAIIARTLAAQRPYAIHWDALYTQTSDGEPVTPEALNGCVVGLCRRTDEPDRLPLCVGLGIVRSVDTARQLYYILTPVDPASLQDVSQLILGTISLPLECVSLGVWGTSFPYQTHNTATRNREIIGAEPMKSRNNILRKGTNA